MNKELEKILLDNGFYKEKYKDCYYFISNENDYRIDIDEKEIILTAGNGCGSFHPIDKFTLIGILFHIKNTTNNIVKYT